MPWNPGPASRGIAARQAVESAEILSSINKHSELVFCELGKKAIHFVFVVALMPGGA